MPLDANTGGGSRRAGRARRTIHGTRSGRLRVAWASRRLRCWNTSARRKARTMKIDIFCEVQKAQESWGEDHEQVLIQETLEQARLADELGYSCWWEVEHHAAGSSATARRPRSCSPRSRARRRTCASATPQSSRRSTSTTRCVWRSAPRSWTTSARGASRSASRARPRRSGGCSTSRPTMPETRCKRRSRCFPGSGRRRSSPGTARTSRSTAATSFRSPTRSRTRGSGRRSARPGASSRPDATASGCC